MSGASGDNIRDEQLIQFLRGELAGEERSNIETWLQSAPENRSRLLEVEVVWQDTGRVEELAIPELNVETALEKVKARKAQLTLEEPQSSGASWILRVAAILVVGLGLSLWFYTRTEAPLELSALDNQVQQTLADGSQLTLEAGSSVEIVPFGETREVRLTGTAYFEVTPDPEKPFLVATDDLQVQVLGTRFSVSEEEELTIVSVEEGRVQVASATQQLILEKNQTASLNRATRTLTLVEAQDTGEHRFWKTKQLAFRSMKLGDVVQTLKRVYKTDIVIDPETSADCLISVSFEDEDLRDVLNIISITLGMQVVEEQNQIRLVGEGC